MMPVVLLHGLIGHLADSRILAAIGREGVIAPHLPGYGEEARAGTADLEAHAEAVLTLLEAEFAHTGVDLVGHSVGWVTAMLVADRVPQRIRTIVSAEGNFSLDDAFWSSRIASKPLSNLEEWLTARRADPAHWLRESDIEPTEERIGRAKEHLEFQSASTIHAMARSVVEVTDARAYRQLLRNVFGRIPVALLAGERSAADWHVPEWARKAARADAVLPGVGHLMPLEAPQQFATAAAGLIRLLRTHQDMDR